MCLPHCPLGHCCMGVGGISCFSRDLGRCPLLILVLQHLHGLLHIGSGLKRHKLLGSVPKETGLRSTCMQSSRQSEARSHERLRSQLRRHLTSVLKGSQARISLPCFANGDAHRLVENVASAIPRVPCPSRKHQTSGNIHRNMICQGVQTSSLGNQAKGGKPTIIVKLLQTAATYGCSNICCSHAQNRSTYHVLSANATFTVCRSWALQASQLHGQASQSLALVKHPHMDQSPI